MVQKKKQRISSKLRKALALKACDYCLDLSKLVFAGIVLVTVIGYNADRMIVLLFGILSTVVFGIAGFAFYIISKK